MSSHSEKRAEGKKKDRTVHRKQQQKKKSHNKIQDHVRNAINEIRAL